jgi:hypothetical protein
VLPPLHAWQLVAPAAARVLDVAKRCASGKLLEDLEAAESASAGGDDQTAEAAAMLSLINASALYSAVAELAAGILRGQGEATITLLYTPPPRVEALAELEEAAERRIANLLPTASGSRASASARSGSEFTPPEVPVLEAMLRRATHAGSEAAFRLAASDFVQVMTAMRPRARIWLGRALLTRAHHEHEAVAVVDVIRRTVSMAIGQLNEQLALEASGWSGLKLPVALQSAANGGAAGLLDDLIGARVLCVHRAIDQSRAAAEETADASAASSRVAAKSDAGAALVASSGVMSGILELTSLLLGVEKRLKSRADAAASAAPPAAPHPSGLAGVEHLTPPPRLKGRAGRLRTRPACHVARGALATDSYVGMRSPSLLVTVGAGGLREGTSKALLESLTGSLDGRLRRLGARAPRRQAPAASGVVAEIRAQALSPQAVSPAEAGITAAALSFAPETDAGRGSEQERRRLLLLRSSLQAVREGLGF